MKLEADDLALVWRDKSLVRWGNGQKLPVGLATGNVVPKRLKIKIKL